MHKPIQCLVIVIALVPSLAAAEEGAPVAAMQENDAAGIALDVEVDPIAYAFAGYSVHAGLSRGRWRLDLGAFAADLPEFAHGNDGMSASFHGVGVKLDVFARRERSGSFIGVEASWARSTIEHNASGVLAVQSEPRLGIRGGYRFMLGERWFVVPWVGISAAPAAKDIVVGDGMFNNRRWSIFPTVHIGYRAD